MPYRIPLALVALLLAAPAAAQMNKCLQPNGRYVYSDLPCPKGAEQAEAPDLTNARGSRYASRMDTSPLPPIDFGNTPDQKFVRARAMIASIRIDARDCDWDMKVTRKHAACAKFLQQMLEGREWSQAVATITSLQENDGTFVERNLSEFQALIRDMEDIVKIKQLAVLRAGR